MTYKNLLIAVLTPLVAAGVKFLFGFLNVDIDEATFNAIVTAVVALFVALFFGDAASAKFPQAFK